MITTTFLALALLAPAADDWDAYVEQYLEEYFELHPTFAVGNGRHEYDGQLPDWTPSGFERLTTWLTDQRDRAEAFDVAGEDAFERDFLVATVEKELFWLERARWPWRNPTFYSWQIDPDVYLSREYAPLDVRMAAYVEWAKNVPAALRQIRANLETPLPKTYVHMGRIGFGGMAGFLASDVPGIFAEVDDMGLQAAFGAANAGAIEAMREMDAWFEGLEADATDDFALGTELFAEMLWATERVDVPLDRLKAIGEADLQRNLTALREACERFMPEESIETAVAAAQARKPEGGAVAAARAQLSGLREFLVENELVSIPGTEEALVAEAPPYQRWNFAYINIPGPYEKHLPSVYYIAPPDPAWTPEEQRDYVPGEADLLFVSVHEVWPGHFLHFLHANRAESKFGQLFAGYAFGEGWAHYTEEMMWEAGLGDGDPVMHIGQLLNALLRNVRYLSAIGLHTGGMTVAESETMFREKAYQDPGNARQQAARGTFDPGYLNYTMGKLMIRELREDWTAERGGRAAWGDFHDAFLSFGGPPIPLVRAAMLGEDAGPPF